MSNVIYAINKSTKEHVIAGPFSAWSPSKWELVAADSGGWIEWEPKPGAICPLNQKDCGYQATLADGDILDGSVCHWDDTPRPKRRVVAYRPILSTKEREK